MEAKVQADVIFRVDTGRDFKGEIIAIFPHEIATLRGHVTIYVHVGQHSSADYQKCIKTSRLASEQEAKDLKAELEYLGYSLNILRKQNYKKYLENYYKETAFVQNVGN